MPCCFTAGLFFTFVVLSSGTPGARADATYLFENAEDPFSSSCFVRPQLLVPESLLVSTPKSRQPCSPVSEVQLPGGTVRGEWRSVGGIFGPHCQAQFMGIPYAQPPTGTRRFKAPVTPPKPWGNHTALKKGSVLCPQLTFPANKLVGEEDCLYLNVYTPEPETKQEDALPVMVYIHGGGFVFGSGDIKESGPDFLVSHKVVLVTFNYRLGALGFLNMDTEDLPGNNGLKDQQAALMWVHENIHLFGGDPKKITIFGNSAGAASSHLHTLNQASNRLIRAAILQSGSALASWAYTEDHVRRARVLAQNFGASPTATPQEIAKILRSTKAADLVVGASNITKTDPILLVTRLIPFVPSPERRPVLENSTQTIFMDRDPEDQLIRLAVDPVPMIMGVSKDEGLFAYYYTGLAALPEGVKLVDQNLVGVLPASLVPNHDTAETFGVSKVASPEKLKLAVQAVRDAYVNGGRFTTRNIDTFIEYLGDVFTINDVHRVASIYQVHSKPAPLYLYQFDVNGDYNLGRKVLSIQQPGVTHTDELGYIFKVTSPDLKQDPMANSISSGSLRFLTSVWTDFAKTLEPFPDQSRNWVPVQGPPTHEKPFLYIGEQVELINLHLSKPWGDLYTLFRTPDVQAANKKE